MGRHVQLVLGAAGSGKSSYCTCIEKHFENAKRNHKILNLDPAAENFEYQVALDVREIISLEDVQETKELEYGPNGGLVFCMETLVSNLEWLKTEIDAIASSDDEYLIVDCPGQIELVTHLPVMKQLVTAFKEWNFQICVVYLVDSTFLDDPSKYISATLAAMSAMVRLEVAHVNLLSKFDLLKTFTSEADDSFASELVGHTEGYISPDIWRIKAMIANKYKDASPQFMKLNEAICELLEEYSLVNFLPFDVHDEDVIETVVSQIDNAIGYGDDVEPRTTDFDG